MYYRNFLIIFLSTVLVACGAGETRKLTTEEIVYGPRDKARLSQIKEGGTFLEDLFKGDDNNETGSGSFVSYNNPLWKASLEVLSSFPCQIEVIK